MCVALINISYWIFLKLQIKFRIEKRNTEKRKERDRAVLLGINREVELKRRAGWKWKKEEA